MTESDAYGEGVLTRVKAVHVPVSVCGACVCVWVGV